MFKLFNINCTNKNVFGKIVPIKTYMIEIVKPAKIIIGIVETLQLLAVTITFMFTITS